MAPRILIQLMSMMLSLVRTLFADKANLALENLALRQQLVVLQRKTPRPRLDDFDRAFWASLKGHFSAWADALIIVKPETVIGWHRNAFRHHWAKKCAGPHGRPRIPTEHIEFIRRISGDHPEYGENRIALELELKLGIGHSAATIRKYMVKGIGPGRARSPQSWSTFLKNQASAIWTCDFCIHRTVKFTALYVFVIMELGSRKVMHINVTQRPTQDWVRQQIRTATYEKQPKFLLQPSTRLARSGQATGCSGNLGSQQVSRSVARRSRAGRRSMSGWRKLKASVAFPLLTMPPMLRPTSKGSMEASEGSYWTVSWCGMSHNYGSQPPSTSAGTIPRGSTRASTESPTRIRSWQRRGR